MGTWGSYPKDNDGALDLQGIINDEINHKLPKVWKLNYTNYQKAGLIMLLLQKGFHISKKYVKLSLEALLEVKIELESQDNTKESLKLLESTKTVIKGFEDLLSDTEMHTKKTILAPVRWLERESELTKGSWSGIGEVD